MTLSIMAVAVQLERDVVAARQRARQIAALLGFDSQDQTRISTAVSETARNAFKYAGGGRVEFTLEGRTAPQLLVAAVSDSGPGIRNLDEVLEGRYRSATGMGMGLIGAKRLMDVFTIDSTPRGTTVRLKKLLPPRTPLFTAEALAGLAAGLAAERPQDALAEVQQQNSELLGTLNELRRRQDELVLVNRELEDTNRGVVALYAELEERADHLRRADEVKSKFLSNMTHEFRTPVNSILALARLLMDRTDGDLTDEQARQVGYIRKAAEDLSELVNDLLDLAKAEAGKVVIRPTEFDVVGLFGALRGMLRPLLLSQSVSLVFDAPTAIPPVYSDENKVSQVLRNLISNALKFTERGEVRVTAAFDETADRVTFAVADTGIGIAPTDHERIFQEFGQIENPMQRKVRGTGLGLPLSRRLAGLLGGSLEVRSEVGLGSTFTFTIPRAFKEARRVAEAAPVPPPDPGRIPVLAVDDRPEDLLVYERLLRESAFQLMPVTNLRDARRAMHTVKPRAVLLDVVLETEDSWSFLAQLKSDAATAGIPVLIVTSVQDQAKAFALGAEACGIKPLDRGWLLGELNRLARPRTALIIDDDEAARYAIGQMIRQAGWETIEAKDGPEGLQRIAESAVGAVFLDVLMPGMNGLDVLRAMRERPASRTLPVFVSTSATLDAADQALIERLGAREIPKSLLAPDRVAAALAEA